MMIVRSLCRSLSLLSLVGASLAAQATWVVGSGGFATIDEGLQAAASGDTVLVMPGSYARFQATRSVCIRAAVPGTVFVGVDSRVTGPGIEVVLVDLDLLFLYVGDASCILDRCRVDGAAPYGGACMNAVNAVVRLSSCTIGSHGTPPFLNFGVFPAGLKASATVVTAVDTTIVGRDQDTYGSSSAFGGSPGVELLAGSVLHASACSIEGGDGGFATSYPPGPAMVATASTVWIADCSLRSGVARAQPGAPRTTCSSLGPSGRLVRSVLEPAGCPPSLPTVGGLVAVSAGGVPTAGATYGLSLRGEAGELFGVFVAFGFASGSIPELEQLVGLDIGTALFLGFTGADGAGQASASWLMPSGTSGAKIGFQVVGFAATPWQLSPVVGGILR